MYLDLHPFIYCFDIACGIFAFGYGAHVCFAGRGVLFLQIVTCAFGCFLLGDIYNLCYFFCLGEYIGPYKNGFGIGSLGYIGGLVFLFSSYYGAMDRIGDDRSKKLFKFRLIPLIPTFFNIVYYILFYLNSKNNIYFLVCMILLSAVSYFAFKHMILPDAPNGILKSLRMYNFLILVFCLFHSLHIVFQIIYKDAARILEIFTGIITLVIIPVATRGVKKWYT